MTRQEWFDSQDVIVQTKFISNCVKLNSDNKFFEDWINYRHDYKEDDIQGAFIWNYSPEGQKFWENLNKIYKEKI
jgi:hypothetical protein